MTSKLVLSVEYILGVSSGSSYLPTNTTGEWVSTSSVSGDGSTRPVRCPRGLRRDVYEKDTESLEEKRVLWVAKNPFL